MRDTRRKRRDDAYAKAEHGGRRHSALSLDKPCFVADGLITAGLICSAAHRKSAKAGHAESLLMRVGGIVILGNGDTSRR